MLLLLAERVFKTFERGADTGEPIALTARSRCRGADLERLEGVEGPFPVRAVRGD